MPGSASEAPLTGGAAPAAGGGGAAAAEERRRAREEAARRRRRAEAFGDAAPTRRGESAGDRWLREQVPPHHGG